MNEARWARVVWVTTGVDNVFMASAPHSEFSEPDSSGWPSWWGAARWA